jgi:hypothetical protein
MPNARRRRIASTKPAPLVSESGIRVRSEDRDTDPAIPARAELTTHQWEDLDRTLFLHTTRLEASVRGGTGARVADAVDAIVGDLDLLGVALVDLRGTASDSPAMDRVGAWWPCVERIYRWAIELAETVEDAAASHGEDFELFAPSVGSIASYSRLLFYALIDSLVRDATIALRAVGCAGPVSSLQRVQERALSLFWTLEVAAAGAI